MMEGDRGQGKHILIARLREQGEGEWTYNDNNELLTVATTEYTYDANGNAIQLLLDGTVMFTYHYNAQDRLVQVDDVNSNTVAEYSYDPFGRRLWKEVNGTRTYFFYADAGLVAEYDTSGTEIRVYGYRPDSTWTTDSLWLKQNGEYYFYQNDHLGTPQKLVQMNGAITWSATYTAFGQATIEIETITNNLRFSGQYYDAETGLHYNYRRYYDPKVGRYLRTDPIGLEGGINLFAYVENNPSIFFDPRGLRLLPIQGCSYNECKKNCMNEPTGVISLIAGIAGIISTFGGFALSALSEIASSTGAVAAASMSTTTIGISGAIAAGLTAPWIGTVGLVIGGIGVAATITGGAVYSYHWYNCHKDCECDTSSHCKPCTPVFLKVNCKTTIFVRKDGTYLGSSGTCDTIAVCQEDLRYP